MSTYTQHGRLYVDTCALHLKANTELVIEKPSTRSVCRTAEFFHTKRRKAFLKGPDSDMLKQERASPQRLQHFW